MHTIPHNGTETSIAAAERIRPDVDRARQRVLETIQKAGAYGCTRDEIARLTGMNPNTVRPRVVELRHAEKIIDTDRKRRGCRVIVVKVEASA